jgi:hemolysin activation/secretion protein
VRFGHFRRNVHRKIGRPILASLLWSAIVSSTPAEAQVPVPPPLPQGSPLPGIAPLQPPNLAPPLQRPPVPTAPGPSTEGATHPVTSVEVDGVTAFPASTVAPLTSGLTGPAVTEGQVEAARRALVDLYRANGYVYTTVRAVIDEGRLRFQVVEGYVVDVKIQPEGDVGPVGTQVLRFLNHLKGQRPLSSSTLERWLLLAQDIPGLTVRSTLNPSVTDPGELTLVAQVSRKAVSGFLAADNRAFALTGPEQGLGVLNLDSFTEFGERTQLSLFGAFNSTNLFGQVSEELFLGGSGLKLRLYGGLGHATPSGPLHDIGYDGRTRVLGAQLSYPLIRARDQRLNLVLAFDAIESDITNQSGINGATQRASYDSLRIIRLGADYDLLDVLLGGGVNSASARFSQGLVALGAVHNGDTISPARGGEKIDFSKASGEVSRTQTLYQWPDDRSLKLRVALGGQFTGDLLPPAEKFYLGGPHFNRGYYYGQVSGDKAATISNELQYNTSLPLPKRVPFDLRSQFYVFYDWGKVWQNNPANEFNVTLQSAGTGVRFYVADSTEIDLEAVYRMNLYPNGSGVGVARLNSTAIYWQVLFRF